MKIFETRQVVMLPIDNESSIYKLATGKLIFVEKGDKVPILGTYQHLYFLSDEPIKARDWVMNSDLDKPFRCENSKHAQQISKFPDKIIFTTDSSLLVDAKHPSGAWILGVEQPLPQPSPEWIKYFIEQYNKGNIITDVEVEYENLYVDENENKAKRLNGNTKIVNNLVINSDNTINIKANEPSEKMSEFLDKVDKLCFEYGYQFFPTVKGWTGKTDANGEYETFACIGNGEAVKLIYIDGDGRGK